jgi:hypothetical protein
VKHRTENAPWGVVAFVTHAIHSSWDKDAMQKIVNNCIAHNARHSDVRIRIVINGCVCIILKQEITIATEKDLKENENEKWKIPRRV